MSGTTGWPLNLNTFDGSDDIVDALTTHFNQNMNNINKANVTAKVWDNNVHYNQWDIVQNKFDLVTMVCVQDHTSSNANSKQMWGDQDGSKWIYLTNFLKLAGFIQNMYIPSGSIFTDGNAIKLQDNGVARATIDRTDSHFLSSRVESWTPNTKYNVGDLVFIKRLNGNQPNKGDIMNGFFRCQSAHVSTTLFPASSDNIWFPINDDAITYMVNINQGNGLMGNYLRKGRMVEIQNSSPTSSSVHMSTTWATMGPVGTIPVQFRPTLGVDALSNINDYNNIFIRRFNKDGSILVKQSWGGPADTGSSVYFTESNVHWFTDAEPYWESAVPTT